MDRTRPVVRRCEDSCVFNLIKMVYPSDCNSAKITDAKIEIIASNLNIGDCLKMMLDLESEIYVKHIDTMRLSYFSFSYIDDSR